MACIRAQDPNSDIQHVMDYLTCDNRTGPKLSGTAGLSGMRAVYESFRQETAARCLSN